MQTTLDLLKYLDRGRVVLARLATPRISQRRFLDNVCRLSEWSDGLPDAHDRTALDRIHYGVAGVWRVDERADVVAQWAYLSNKLMLATESAEHADATERERCLADARYYLDRMRLLAVRGDDYSPHLTRDELASDLRANGITLDGGSR